MSERLDNTVAVIGQACRFESDLDRFDAGFFGINHREAEILDPQQRVFLEACWEALEDAGCEPGGMTGVFAGQPASTYLLFNLLPTLAAEMDPLQLLVGNAADSLATRVSYKLNLKGPSFTVQGGGSRMAAAVHLACQSLLNGECDLALAGAVSIDARSLRDGEAGVLVLKRAEEALRDRDGVRALVVGSEAAGGMAEIGDPGIRGLLGAVRDLKARRVLFGLTLEPVPAVSRTMARRERYFLPVSARSEAALESACRRLADWLEEHPELDLADVEFTLRVGRRTFEHQRIVECRTREEASEALRTGTAGVPPASFLVGVGGTPALAAEARRVSLPTYPFERRRYWIEAVEKPDSLSPVLAMAAGSVQTLHPRPGLFNPYEAPRDEREETVCRIWREILGVEPVGVHDNFFQLGGHSLLATQILSRVREEFAIDFPLQHLFSFPTAAELAEAIGSMEALETERISPSLLREAGGPYPLSFAQQRLWFLDRLDPGTPAFNVPAAIGLRGNLNVAALHRALNEVVRRHETLRTRFPSVDGKVSQEILPELEVPLPVVELSDPEEERRLILRWTSRSFDLATGPLISAVLLRLAPGEHRLVLVVHHIVTDGWSMGVLQVELTQAYRAALDGEASPLPGLPIQYLDFADWQRNHFQGEALRREIDYWSGRLSGIPFLDLRGDRPRPPVQTFRGEYVDFQLPAGLEALTHAEGASPFMVFLTGYKILLQRYSQQDDFGVGALIANRTRAEVEGLIGFFVNNLALRTDLSGNPTARELLRRVRTTTLEAYEHQDIPFEKILEEVRFERDLSRSPVVQAMLNLLNFPAVYEELPGLAVSTSGIRNDRANFDLSLWMAEGPEGTVGWLEYNTDLFDRTTARRMVEHLRRVYAALASHPDRPILDIPLLSDAERREVLEVWNRTERPRPAGTFVDLFAAQVERTPDRVAAVCEGRSLTYRELDLQARRWARALAGRGVGPESLAAIVCERGLGFLTAVLAVFQAGGAYLPLDPDQPEARNQAVLDQSGARWVLTGEELQGDGTPVPPGQENLAYVIYTSGSTGTPKGAMVHHRGMLNHLLAKVEDLELTAADAVAQNASQCFDISVWQLLCALVVGGRVHIYPDAIAHDPAALLAAAERDGITILEVVPSVLAAMLELPETPALASLRWMIPTGEALPPELCRRWLALHPSIPLLNAYGPTECSDDVAHHPIRVAPRAVHTPIGKPIANTRLYILDRELRPLPPGVAGELCVGGLGVGRGYRFEPSRTARVFVPDPFGDGSRLYRTGDLARWLPAGEIEFLGRVDFQVKVRGFRIEPGEIESVLGRHPAVHQAVVQALEEKGQKHLVAWVVGDEVDVAALKSFARERLPEYMVPAAIVVLAGMPLTPNGKVDRKALPAPAWEGGGFVPPSTPMETSLARLWAGLFALDQVGARDGFFELGGHSLLATRLVSRVASELGLELPLRWIFETPVLADLAGRLESLRERSEASPVRRVPRDGPLPLSFAQERLWIVDQLAPGSPLYNLPSAVRLEGRLDAAALASALREIVRRHEALRTRFGDGPVQVIDENVSMVLPVIDLEALPAEVRRSAAGGLSGEEARQPFDLRTGPLLRARLLRLAAEEHIVLVNLHHIVSDAWSAWVLVREMAALYQGAPLPALPVQYADYAVWQREHLRGEVLGSQIRWWMEELRGAPTLLEMPADRPRPAVLSFRGATEPVSISAGLMARLASLAREQGGTLFMALLAGFQALIHRCTAQEDVLVGSPVANRRREEVEGLIGFFVNALVLRGRPAPGVTFRALLDQARRASLGAFSHQDVPFERLVEEMRVERSLSHSPLFQVVLALQNAPAEPLIMPGLAVSPWTVPSETAKFDLTLSLTGTESGLEGWLEYSTDLFDRGTIVRLIDRFALLLEGAADRPDRPIAELPVIAESERLQLLAWSRGEEVDAAATIHGIFEEQAARRPETIALRFPGGEMSYAELNARADALAAELQIDLDDLVALCMKRSAEAIVAMIAILKAGGAFVPLDPAYPAERLAFLLADSGARVVPLSPHPPAPSPGTGEGETCKVDPDNLAYVMYTSGSTGQPKGVAVTHRNVVRLVRDRSFMRFAADEVFLQFAPISFDASTLEIWGALLHGGTLTVLAPHTPTLEELGREIQRFGVTSLWLTVGLFHPMIEEQAAALRGVRQLVAGGDALSVPHVRKALRELPETRLINGYGPTENTTFTCCHTIREPLVGSVPIGRPIAGTRVFILDASMRPVPPGVAGELCAGGDGLARGYLRRPELTAERFVPDPASGLAGERLYRTGDLARFLPDGAVEFLGRIDQQVKIRGFRIEPGEIEAALAAQPEVSEAAVVVRGASGEKRLMACVVAPPEAEAGLRAALRARLPDYMVPADWIFLDALPLNPNGKVDRQALARIELRRAAEDFEAPRNAAEELLAGLWADVLGRERVGIRENFFAIGGHSLLGARVMSRVRQAFGAELPLRALFESPTVGELAARIEREGHGEELPPLLPAPRDGAIPLSFAQERLRFLDRLAPGSPVYNIPSVLRASGALDVPALRWSLAELVRRHEALRTTFPDFQEIRPASEVPLPVIDLRALPAEIRDRESRRLAADEARRPFDLERGPLLRAALLRTEEREHVALFTLHHIAGDGWSMGVVVREIGALYSGSTLPELPIQYADFSLWQRSWLRGAALESRISWWREELAGAPAVLELPTDRPRPAVQSFRGATERFPLPALDGLARREGATLFMVLLAGVQALLGRYTGREDVLVGSPVAGRDRPEVEGLVGLFVNTLVMRGRLAGSPSFRGLLARTRASALGAYAHQELPFERLVDELAAERSLSHNPLFQVLFALQNAPMGELSLRGLTLSPLPVQGAAARVDLALSVTETDGVAEYSTDLFDRATVLRVLGHLRALLEGIALDPEVRLSDLPLLSEVERHQLGCEWNDGFTVDTTPVPLLFERQVERTPDAPAVIFQGEMLTYSELSGRAEALAGLLQEMGVGPEDRVGVALERSLDLPVAVLGIWKAGAAYVPLDPGLPEERLVFLRRDSGLLTVVTADVVQEATRAGRMPAVPADGSLAYLIYTSGSTGQPKAVLVEHGQLAHTLAACRRLFDFRPGNRMPCIAPFPFDIFLFELLNPLLSGGAVEIFPLRPALELERLVEALPGATHFHAVPALMRQVVERVQAPSLREVFVGGDAVPGELLGEMARAFPSARIFVLYGPTEATLICSAWPVPPGASRTLLGRPLPGSALRVTGPDGSEMPIGVAGEIRIGGGGVARGYLHQPALTAERFVPGEGRWYRTGDLARRLADGALEFLGRIDHQVKIRGFRVELGEIEARLRAHPAVREAVVLSDGEGLTAYVIATESEGSLRAWLAAALPDYMVPSSWVFLDALPLSSNGKVDRRALARIEPERTVSEAPRTAAEELLAGIWADVLGRERVGIRENFFAIGGHSLLGTRVMSRVRQAFGKDLPLRALFESPTVEALAARIGQAGRREELPPLAPAPQDGAVPLSFAQERLWVLDRLAPRNPVYNIPSALRAAGGLDVPALRWSLGELVRRHEALRTTFSDCQVIHPASEVPLPVIDLRALPAESRDREARRLAADEARQPFDLERGPLLRAALVRTEEREHVLLFTLHHIAGDGWSMGVVVREIGVLYSGSTLPELPIQYADFSLWQRGWLRGAALESRISWWREELAGAPAVLDLPADRPRPAVQSFRGATERFSLPDLGGLARREGGTLFMVLLAGLQALLGRYTGQEDVLVGSPVAGRDRAEVEGLVGLFVNTLVMRGRLAGNPSFRGLLGRTRASALGAYAHQELPFERLVDELAVERSLSHNPLFQVIFALHNAPAGELSLPGLTLSPLPAQGASARVDLALSATETDGVAEYSTDLFDRATVLRLLGHLRTLLDGAAADPEARISDLSLLSEVERHQLGCEWNDGFTVDTTPVPLLFERQVEKTPDAPAVVFQGETLTYSELSCRAEALAGHLQEMGVGPEDRVGVALERSLDLPVAVLGIWKAGAAYVPLDPGLPEERLAFLRRDSGLRVIVTRDVVQDAERAGRMPAVPADGQLAYLIYTSGSTGQPKAVLVEHGQLAHTLAACRRLFDFRPGDRMPCIAPFPFDIFLFELLNPLLSGGAVEIFPLRPALEVERLVESLAGATHFHAVPALMRQVAERVQAPGLREVFVGGDAVPGELLGEMARAFPSARIFVLYGPTEAAILASAWPVPAGATRTLLGRPLPGSALRVTGPDGSEVPIGVAGEIRIGGGGVARGYLNQPALTAERFVPGEGRWYRTGDLARRLADGALEFLGRIDHQVKIRGFRVELGEIEARLRSHLAVREAVVLSDGEGLTAYVVAAEGEGSLRAWLSAALPDYMVPSSWVFLDALPLSPNGKVDRRALARIEPQRTAEGFEAPRTPTEELLAGLWSELLKVGQVGRNDGFFELGGHSLLGTRLASRIRDVFGVEVPLRAVFEAPRLADLAARIEAGSGSPVPPIEPWGRRGPAPLSFAQERLWFLDRIEPGTALYSIPAALRISGRLDIPALRGALRRVVQRHEALRTTFGQRDGAPFQTIAPALDVAVPVADLSALSRNGEVEDLLRREARRPFDLERGPLLRVLLVRAGEDDWSLLLNLHHIVADGWSAGVLVRELAALYAGEALPDLPVQYSDFAAWQRRWLSGDVLREQIEAWKEALAGAPLVLDLPCDHPRPPVRSFRGAHRKAVLPPVRDLARGQGATLFMTVLAGFQALLHRYTGQEDVIVGLPIAGRRRSELEGLVGLFVNALPLRGRMAGDPPFAGLLARVRSAALDAYAHQDLPFERLVEELRIERTLARHPVFQAVISWGALQNLLSGELRLPGLTLSPLDLDSGTAKVDLLLALAETEDGLAGGWEYSTDLFEAATIERMTGHLATLLAAAADDPELRLSDLPLLTAAESAQLRIEWNDTGGAEAGDLCLHDLFLINAELHPSSVAAVCGDRRLTYGELAGLAEGLAGRLRARGVGPEVLVGLCLEEGLERLVAVLGVFLAGGAYLPLDPTHPADRIAYMVEDAGADLVLHQEDLASLPLSRSGRGGRGVRAANLAHVIYTSGSTGRPNGVLVTHGSAVRLILHAIDAAGLGRHSRVLQHVSFSFDASVLETWTALASGGTLCIAPREARLSGGALAEIVRREGVTLAAGTPSVLALLPTDLPTLDTFLVGGDTCPAELADRWAPPASGLRHLYNCYGPTETTIYVASADLRGPFRREPPIGRPVADARAYVLDPAGRPVPIGVPGQLHMAGPGLARGYLSRPALTAERYVPDPFGDAGERLYRTGDLARRLPGGNLEFLGRIDRQVKIRGLRIELGEIEAALGAHPAVRECAVLVREAGGDRRLSAYVVPQAGEGELDLTADLRAHLRGRLPESMVPAGFIFLEAMPLTPTGKVDRAALPGLEAARVVPGTAEPRDALELRLAGLWAEVLGVPRVGVRDGFFELGGHSLLAVRLLARVEQELGRDLPLSVLFEGGTVERMAALLRREGAPLSCLVPIQPAGEKPPFFCVHPAGGDVLGYALLARLLDRPFYGLQSRGLLAGAEPHARVEDMAADYLEEIRGVQPAGPYRLGGWSLGGLIAYEMARQLRARGEEVALLAVLDAAPEYAGEEESELDRLLGVAAYIGSLRGVDLRLTSDGLAEAGPDGAFALLLERLRAVDLLPPGGGEEQIRRVLDVYRANSRAARAYAAGPYADRVTLLRTGTDSLRDLGWGRITGGPVEVHALPGEHLTLLAEPHVHALAQRLRVDLAEVPSAPIPRSDAETLNSSKEP
ncbi:MAG: non-ribosomal peptide synthase/polyketide synthase [Acidobacteriota bacterium]